MSRAAPLPKPLTIWIINPFDDIPGEGLPPLRYWSLARVLAGRGHNVIWWSATWSHRRKATRSVPLGIRDEEGFSVRLVATRPYKKDVSLARFASHRNFGRTFERLANESIASGQLVRPDLIVASLAPLDSLEAAARLAQRLDANLIVDSVEIWPDSFERLMPGPQWLKKILSPLFLSGMYRRRHAVIQAADALSSATQIFLDTIACDLSSDSRGDKTAPYVCPFGAYLQEFNPPPRTVNHVPVLHEKTAATSDTLPLQCVYSGMLAAGQDVDTLIAAAKILSASAIAATLHIAGTGPFEDSLRKAAAALGGSCRVRVHGLLHRKAYVQLLSECDVGLVLVRPESPAAIPYKACDYAAAGLAIVNSLPGELESLITRFVAGLKYTAGDAASLARAISLLASNRPLLLDYRQGARQLAEAEFDREKLYSQFAQWIEATAS